MKVVIFLLLAAFLATAQSLNCYQCTDCEKIGDSKPSTCEGKTTEVPTTTDEETTDTTTTEAETPLKLNPQPGLLLGTAPEFIRNYRSAMTRQRRETTNDGWFCYEVHFTDKNSNSQKVNRGCTTLDKGNTCKQELESQTPGEITDCTLCENDGCRSASAIIQLSFSALCTVFIVKILS